MNQTNNILNNINTQYSNNNSVLNNFSSDIQSLSVKSFEQFREYIYINSGIYFQDNKKYLLESRLLKRVNRLNLETFEDYLSYIQEHTKKTEELKQLFEAITINETFFFRNQPQLDALSNKILPELIKKKYNSFNKKIRIWSAASSSGEEPYSLAMMIKEHISPKFPGFTFEIVGTDISSEVLNKAKSGVYKEYSIRNTPIYFLKKYFTQRDNVFELTPDIVKMVKFSELNLSDDFKMRTMKNFDVIICANVLIYFDTKSKMKVINHLYNSLDKGGYLFIGYSETLHGISQAFKLVSFPKTIGYMKE